ncbi:MAG: cobalamin B12-binding domain-containing protein [Deltaproteobacteria bacterium]|nr:cobalamin B12-binding domain-containing protein [Deltaproteobacteria bacterium]
MKVLLLIPPTDLSRSYGKLKKFSNPQPSIGIAYIAALLRENGHDVKVTDAYVNGYGMEEIMVMVREFNPDALGISVLTPSAEVVYEISKHIRNSFPDIVIIMGNMHASLFSDEILSQKYADFVVHREGELTMQELLATLADNGNPDDVAGISFMKNGVIINNPMSEHIADLNSLPLPAWDLFPLSKYSTDPRTEVKRGVVEMQILSTRGCPNQCTFCSSRTERSLGSRYRMRDPKLVVDEMVFMYEKFGSRVFSFMDLAFTLVKSHAAALCNEIINRGLNKKLKWVTECRVKPLEQDLLFLMKEAGCVRVNFGIESGSDDILKMLKKNFTTHDARDAVRMAKKAGIEIDGMFMIGLPCETESSIRQTIDFAVELNVRYAIFNIFVPYPGCELWDMLNSQNKIQFKKWSDFTSYPTYSGGEPVYVPDALSKEKIMKLQSMAMKKFYLRPKFVLNEIKNFKIDKIPHYIDGLMGLFSKRKANQ